jgi:hypothetical protein
MHAQRKVPVLIAAIVAVVGQTVILFNDFGPGNNSKGSGNTKMVTALAVSRAGAVEIPSVPPGGRSASRQAGETAVPYKIQFSGVGGL